MKEFIVKLKVLFLIYGLRHIKLWRSEVWKQEAYERYCCDGYMCGCYAFFYMDIWEDMINAKKHW